MKEEISQNVLEAELMLNCLINSIKTLRQSKKLCAEEYLCIQIKDRLTQILKSLH